MTLPQQETPKTHKKHRGATKTLKHSQTLSNNRHNTQSQTNTRPNKPATNQQHQSAESKRTRHKKYVPSVKGRQGLQIESQTPSARNKSPSENFRVSTRQKRRYAEGRRRKHPQNNAVGKKQQWEQYAIYRGTAPRYTKRSATLSLKRHIAWEYTETTTHHKCLSLSAPPLATWPNKRKKPPQFQKANHFLTRPFLHGQNGQVKKGGIVGTPPPENTCHAPHGDT